MNDTNGWIALSRQLGVSVERLHQMLKDGDLMVANVPDPFKTGNQVLILNRDAAKAAEGGT